MILFIYLKCIFLAHTAYPRMQFIHFMCDNNKTNKSCIYSAQNVLDSSINVTLTNQLLCHFSGMAAVTGKFHLNITPGTQRSRNVRRVMDIYGL